jgi:hypothetical protein
MERGEYRPGGEQFAQGSGVSPFDALVERLTSTGESSQCEERGLQLVHPHTPFYLMHSVNQGFDGVYTYEDLGFEPTEGQNQFVKHVKLAYGIIAHPFVEEWIYQQNIEHIVALDRVYEGNNKVVLTDEEREILVKIAKAAGIPCDPERSEYFYDEIPRMILQGEGFVTPKVVDADQ